MTELWLSCDLAVTELWPLLAVTEPWSLSPGAVTTVVTVSSRWPFIFSWAGITHLFSRDPERLFCPVRTLGLYIVRSQELADEDPQQKLFVHFTPKTQMFTTHFRRWVAETIGLTYENSESDFPTIRSHEVQAVAALVAYYRNTPPSDLCGLIGWKSSNVFVHHYLRDMAADTDLQEV